MDTTLPSTPSAGTTLDKLPRARDIIKSVWKFFWANVKVLWPLYVIVGFSDFINKLVNDKDVAKYIDKMSVSTQALIYVGSFVLSIVAILATIALFKAVFDIKKGQFENVKASFSFAVKNIWSYVVIVVVAGLAFIGSFALLIIPGILMALYLSFSIMIMIEEGKRPIESMLRSWSIVKGNTVNVFTTSFVVSIIWFIVYLLTSALLAGVAFLVVSILGAIGLSGFGVAVVVTGFITFGVITMAVTPLSTMTMIEIYLAQKGIYGDVVISDDVNKKRKIKIVGSAILGICIPIAIAIIVAITR